MRNLTVIVGCGDLAAIAMKMAPPNAVVIFDVGDGLHFTTAHEAMRNVGRVARMLPVVATTHNPFALEGVSPGEVLVCDGVNTARLTEHPEFEHYRTALRVEELWANLGEAWVADVKR